MPGREGVEQPDEAAQQPQVPLVGKVPTVPLPDRPLTEADREALADREGVEAVLRMVRVDSAMAGPLAGAATAFLLVHRAGWAVYETVAVSEAWAALRRARREALEVT
jgi:hypothetical protein